MGIAAGSLGCNEPVTYETCPGGPLLGTAYIEDPELVGWSDEECGGMHSFEGIGDFDGDGRLDLLGLRVEQVWCPGPGEPGHGCAYDLTACIGPLDGLPTLIAYVEGIESEYVTDSDARGDLDGDGLGDFVLRSPTWYFDGAWLVRGAPESTPLDPTEPSAWSSPTLPHFADNFTGSGTTALVALYGYTLSVDTLDPDTMGVTAHTRVTSLDAFAAAAPVGDLDGDGREDVGYLREDGSGWVLHGGDPLELAQDQLPPERLSTFELPGAYLIDGAGDFNGDGFGDLAIAVELGDNDHAVYVVFGGARRPLPDANALQTGNGGLQFRSKYRIRDLEAIGDFSGDGVADLAIENDAAVHIVYGRAETDGEDLAEIARGCGWGRSFRHYFVRPRWTGDLDGDGRDDLAMREGVVLTGQLD